MTLKIDELHAMPDLRKWYFEEHLPSPSHIEGNVDGRLAN